MISLNKRFLLNNNFKVNDYVFHTKPIFFLKLITFILRVYRLEIKRRTVLLI
jgi:hypothetical protein